ncbi:MAG: FtsW/RodA/SpoVE family cell cycle protein [Alphaproteobacteria bacterium]|nr:FtsW/RodA/SpoVE family cell cycle protein [Alphaproteobacteria bacterium]
MLRITRGEDSKLTSWYFEIDRGLLGWILLLIIVGFATTISAGAAEATRIGEPWFHFLKKAILPYSLGFFALFGCSMLNKQQVIRLSVAGVIFSILALLATFIVPHRINGSLRWVNIMGIKFMPADVLKPFFIVLTAWFLSKMHEYYGNDIFMNKNTWRLNKISWIPYLLIFLICVGLIFKHPDVGTSVVYVFVLFVMLFVAGFPLKWLPYFGGFVVSFATIALLTMPHIRHRAMHIFDVEPRTQAWYSLNAIRNGGLFGSGDKSYVKDVLPESINDFVFASFAEDWGGIVACLLIVVLFTIFCNLVKHAMYAKDKFVVYAVSGVAALFAGQICFNLMTALHLFIDKGMTLPFVSYGGISFIVFCVLFGITLAIIREDTWNN